ncbi:histidinol dehydrogenase [Clostridium paraputrificum]|uniref:histidinol dehydrogenase n=1 Tax=Clostridium TaxID=1485 RepID=UPI000C07568A|nr:MULTISPECIES: histidinol dehydrogenase [Clostridium]MBS7131471.1 histidinol dehydrogenase [Clostridium sp.]MDB2074756.1 histidinol dehydrogenase [Clostridium paraputrificum]MDB2079311.1 histidinol dehydrogenase [Clostridium paraputrificum]MDB2093621.1 histidinol dehydrogenase [Clostridium paraputrificum]MDB2099862.1 histidinol dehydrogenase [Clostridium paraputrificum]
MLRLINLENDNWDILLKELKDREEEVKEEVLKSVSNIIEDVRKNGDKALKSYTEKFDRVMLDDFEVSIEELDECFMKVEKNFIENLEEAKENIEYYHNAQKGRGFILNKDNGIFLGQRVIPLDSVGVYVPGGTAAYPSSVLMNVIPAKVAGVKEIIMITPPNKEGKLNPYIGVAAKIAGVSKIYKVGGAQGIAALANGTESIPKVDKIVGPGNVFVATAKRLVFGKVDIDMIAGPSEILVIADENANPKYIAADLMSQAEHDRLASSILVTTSKKLYKDVEKELEIQIKDLDRKEIIEESLRNYGKAIICNSIEECIEVSNRFAPEHLEFMVDNSMELLGKVRHAGSVFLGNNTPEPVGDYFGGTNHVLPTNGTARFYSALSVDSFIKKSSFLYYSEEAIKRDGEKIINIANKEGLTAHANSVKVRLK